MTAMSREFRLLLGRCASGRAGCRGLGSGRRGGLDRSGRRGGLHCALDDNENAPFGSVGGLDERGALNAPDYIPEDEREEYLNGYVDQAYAMYGSDWMTCSFGWSPAIVLNPKGCVMCSETGRSDPGNLESGPCAFCSKVKP